MLVAVELAEQPVGRDSDGPKYLVGVVGLLAAAGVGGGAALDDVLEALRVGASKVLKSWSRSTGEVVLSAVIGRPPGARAGCSGPGLSET